MLRRERVDLVDLLVEVVFGELDLVRAEAVRFDQLGARLDVGAMDLFNDVALAQVELIVTAVDEHTLRVEHRPHRAIENVGTVIVNEIFKLQISLNVYCAEKYLASGW